MIGIVLFWRLCLWLLPLSWVIRMVRYWPRLNLIQDPSPSRDLITTTIPSLIRASHQVPGATCLTQALALFMICRSSRIAVTLRLGVSRDPDGYFQSHAWIEKDQEVVLGNENLLRYTVIYEFGSQ